MSGLRIAFFGSSLLSAYWNGAATYYRGIVYALAARGHRITFYEPDIYERQQHRDIADPDWATVVVYPGHDEAAVWRQIEHAASHDLIIKASGVGEFDQLLERAVLQLQNANRIVAFWDVDAPATLERITENPADPFLTLIPQYDFIFTYGGGDPMRNAYLACGARHCEVVYNALDPQTHHPSPTDTRFAGDLGLLANRLPDRESRIEEFFLTPAAKAAHFKFVLGGSGWHDKHLRANVSYVGHVFTADHNVFNCTPRAVLNVNRESMVRFGFSPPTRLFEAAGAAACLITDQWEGIDLFLEPGREVLIARNGDDVLEHLQELTPQRASQIGQAAYRRICAHHTYSHRATQLEELWGITPQLASSNSLERAANG